MKVQYAVKIKLRIVAVIGSIFILCGALFAQKQLVHESKVYISSEGRMYIQKSLPVYLRMATSPDDDANTYLLKSEVTTRYSNPMYFDTEGYNTIRSPWIVDTITKRPVYPQQDIIFEVYADGYPPQTRAKFEGTAHFIKEGKKYFGTDIKVNMSAIDGLSGIDKIYYSLNGENYRQYTEPISTGKEGEYTLKYYSVDNVGNAEEPKEENYIIDFTAPESQYEIKGLLNENYVSPDAKILLSSKDEISGVKGIYYQINDGKVLKYYNPIPVTALGDESGSMSFYAVDNLGNKEKVKIIGNFSSESEQGEEKDNQNVVFRFYIDDTPPEISINIEGNKYDGKYLYLSQDSKISINADDDKSGVENIYYSINNSSLSELYSQPFGIKNQGLQYLNYAAVDFVGNKSLLKTEKIFLDLTAPVTRIDYTGLKFFNRDTFYITENTEIVVSCTETESGINKIFYKIDDGEIKEYSSPLVIKKGGYHTITYYGIDNLNNKEAEKYEGLYVDNKPPVIHHHFNVAPIGTKVIREEDFTIYPITTILYLGATDYESGGERIEYIINDGPIKTELPVNNFKPGNYTVKITAFDELSNKQTSSLTFSIEK